MLRRAGVLDLPSFGLSRFVPEAVFVCVCDSVAQRLQNIDGAREHRPVPGAALPGPGTSLRRAGVTAEFPLHGYRVERKRLHAHDWQLACLRPELVTAAHAGPRPAGILTKCPPASHRGRSKS